MHALTASSGNRGPNGNFSEKYLLNWLRIECAWFR
jgi:hypothetical protein